MAVITGFINILSKNNFIFINNSILVKKDSINLPEIDFIQQYIKTNDFIDYYYEESTDTNALLLKDNSPVIDGLEQIPLRQYFWQTKDEDDIKKGALSQTGILSARSHGFLMLRKNYKYCPKCGGRFTDDKKETALLCTKCGNLQFPRIEPCIIVLVTKGDKILLVKNKIRNTFYSCIAGFVEHGESLEQCVEREVKEETNLDIQNIKYITSQAWPFPDQLMAGFFAEYKGGQIKCQEEEIEDAQWFSPDELPTIPNPGSIAWNIIKLFYGPYCHK